MSKFTEEKFLQVLDNIEDGYYEVDLAGNFTFFNATMVKILGYSEKEMIGMSNRKYMSPETAKKVYSIFNEIYRTGKPTKALDWELIRKDGKIFTVETSISLMRNQKNEPIGFQGILRDITERKIIEEALQQSEEKHRGILENLDDGYYETDLEGNFTFFNDALCKIFGYSSTELLNSSYKQLMEKETTKNVFKAFNQVYKTGKSLKLAEGDLIRKDGARINIEASVSLITDAKGNPIGFRGIQRDVTQRKETEIALRVSEEKHRTILETIQEGYYEVDLEGNLTFFNESFRKMFGYPREEMMGLNYREYTSKQIAKRVFETFNTTFRTGIPSLAFDWEFFRKDGTKWILEASVSLIKDMNGNPIGFRGLLRDITSRKEEQKALRESEARYRSLVDTSPDAIVLTNIDGKILKLNQQAANMAGVSSTKELEGKNAFDFIKLGERSLEAVENMRKLIAFGSLKNIEFNFKHPDGSLLPADLNASVVPDESGLPKYFVAVIRDISERKKQENRHYRLQKEVSELAHSIADEMKEHLISFEGYMDFLISDPRSDETTIKRLRQLVRNMNELIQHIVVLADAGIKVHKWRIVNLNILVEKVAESIIPKRISFVKDFLKSIEGDEAKLYQIFEYIFENAVSHGDPTEIKISTEEAENHIKIVISNDGHSIPVVHRQDIFKHGFSLKKGALGLGLPIVQNLVEAHGWEIELADRAETTFIITILKQQE